MEISHSSWPWHRSDATALAGYANMMMMSLKVRMASSMWAFLPPVTSSQISVTCCTTRLHSGTRWGTSSNSRIENCSTAAALINPNHGRPQAWARVGHLPIWKCCKKCFCALVVTAKRSVDELFMHYFHHLSSASGGFDPRPHPGSISGPAPLGD